MIRLLAYFLLILVGLCASPWLIGHTGYLYLAIGEYQIETSLVFAAIMVVFFLATVQTAEFLLIKLLSTLASSRYLPEKWRNALAKRHGKNGAVAWIKGNWSQAETLLAKSAEREPLPLIHWLAAAKAASKQHKDVERNRYLSQARQQVHSNELVDIVMLECFIDQQQWTQAHQALSTMNLTKHSAPILFEYALTVYQQQQDWQALDKLLPQLKKLKKLPEPQLENIANTVHFERLQLACQESLEATEQYWNNLNRDDKKQAEFIACYARGLDQHQAHAKAMKQLLASTKKQSELVLLQTLAEVSTADDLEALKRLNTYAQQYQEDVDYQLLMADLHQKLRQLPEAKEHLIKACELAPSAQAWRQLAQVQQQLGDNEAAQHSYRKSALAVSV